MHTTPLTPEQTKTALDHLAGLPPILMIEFRERIEKRIKAGYVTNVCRDDHHAVYTDAIEVDPDNSDIWRMVSDAEAKELSLWMLHQMMHKRIESGKQFDSVLDSSRTYFAAQQLRMVIRDLEPKE